MNGIVIRQSTSEDVSNILSLYPAAFPEEDLLPLVKDLVAADNVVISLVAESDKHLIGHAVLTRCSMADAPAPVALLGPIAVVPDKQRQGVGSTLIREGIAELRADGYAKVLVLGDPNYYSRFGFLEESTVMPPYPLPEEWQRAWQSLNLNDEGVKLEGILAVPKMWQQEKLWSE